MAVQEDPQTRGLVQHGHVHLAYASQQDGLGAGRGPSVVGARLQGHVEGGTPRKLPGPGQGHRLGMRARRRPRVAPGHLLPVADHHRPHRRVGGDASERPSRLGQGKSHERAHSKTNDSARW